uniref:Carbonic anhydrase n=1 Tax=Panagrellus redivivus TaxID=6233 RepID=A0A7E4VV08_PANRE
MAFLEQLSAKFSELSPKINSVVEQANKAKQNLVPVLNKCTQQLDTLGKILQVNANRQQSPIDLLPSITAFDPDYENVTFTFNYDDTANCVVKNIGQCLQIKYPEGSNVDFTSSLFPGEEYHLETVNIHWGTEPMNGSEHTVGGVGYAGEIHFIHRNLKYLNLDLAAKQPNGVVGLSVFLNESHDDNTNLISLNNVLSHVHYAGTEAVLQTFKLSALVPTAEKLKEFWHYEGSETVEPYRETVKWIIFRAATPVSSSQLDTWRALRRTSHEDEIEEKMVPLRALQPANSRIVRSSFKSVAQAELPAVQKNFTGTG